MVVRRRKVEGREVAQASRRSDAVDWMWSKGSAECPGASTRSPSEAS